MDRRAFAIGLGAVLAAPLTVDGQQAAKVYRLGFLGLGSRYWRIRRSSVPFARRFVRKDGSRVRILSSSIGGRTTMRDDFRLWRAS
jgi:hypothetical protein